MSQGRLGGRVHVLETVVSKSSEQREASLRCMLKNRQFLSCGELINDVLMSRVLHGASLG